MSEKDDCYEGIIIRQNSLIKRKWVKPVYENEDDDEPIQEGYYSEEDVTDLLPVFLTSKCKIEEGTTLRDIFKLLKKHRDILGIIQQRNWFNEYIDYGLNSPIMEYPPIREYNGLDIEYLEIYFQLNHDLECKYDEDVYTEWGIFGTDKKTKHKLYSAGQVVEENADYSIGFHAQSYPLGKRDIEHNKSSGYDESWIGKRNNIGFFGSDLPTFIDYPIVISNTLTFTTADHKNHKYDTKELKNFMHNITLIEIIDAIFYEISFNGCPDDSKKFTEELHSAYNLVMSEVKIKKEN